ncbi:MAG TPA: hypothetical protein VIS72_12500, partial [Anaerolineales bacterium]
MLIHECADCEYLSINRIAADDDPDTVMEVFRTSLTDSHRVYARCSGQGIAILKDADIVAIQLYGQIAKIPAPIGDD